MDQVTLLQDQNLETIEKRLLALPPADIPVSHYFGPGAYLREVRIPKGTIAMGHTHKHESINILAQGRVLLLNLDGTTSELSAPFTFTAPPGRKVAYAIEDVVWINVHPTTETDLDKLEAMYIEKSATWLEHERKQVEDFAQRIAGEEQP